MSSSELEEARNNNNKRLVRSPKRSPTKKPIETVESVVAATTSNYNPKYREQMLAHKNRDQMDRTVTTTTLSSSSEMDDPSLTRIDINTVRRRDKPAVTAANANQKPMSSSPRLSQSENQLPLYQKTTYPVARAYEGSDSGEDLDVVDDGSGQSRRYEKARETLVADNADEANLTGSLSRHQVRTSNNQVDYNRRSSAQATLPPEAAAVLGRKQSVGKGTSRSRGSRSADVVEYDVLPDEELNDDEEYYEEHVDEANREMVDSRKQRPTYKMDTRYIYLNVCNLIEIY